MIAWTIYNIYYEALVKMSVWETPLFVFLNILANKLKYKHLVNMVDLAVLSNNFNTLLKIYISMEVPMFNNTACLR